jgi:hypothetical protein
MISELEEAHDAFVREILAANEDFPDRLVGQNLRVVFDLDEDYFLFELGGPQESITESLNDDVTVRIHPHTLKINAIEVYNYSAASKRWAAVLDFMAHAVALTALSFGQIEGVPYSVPPARSDTNPRATTRFREIATSASLMLPDLHLESATEDQLRRGVGINLRELVTTG